MKRSAFSTFLLKTKSISSCGIQLSAFSGQLNNQVSIINTLAKAKYLVIKKILNIF